MEEVAARGFEASFYVSFSFVYNNGYQLGIQKIKGSQEVILRHHLDWLETQEDFLFPGDRY